MTKTCEVCGDVGYEYNTGEVLCDQHGEDAGYAEEDLK